jgi:glycosyltransferase involved in cell wall biosynthesis
MKDCIFLENRTDKMVLLGAMDVGVITSDSEGLSNSIMEYMASGLPCVATNVGGNPELVHHGVNGFLTKAGDAAQLAEWLVTLADNPDLNNQFRQKAREMVLPYDWTQRIDPMLEYYQKLSKVEPK